MGWADARRTAAPKDPNAHYFFAFAAGRYGQGISVAKALAQGLGGKVRDALQVAMKLEPKHADAHIAYGSYQAEVIDKVGGLVAGVTYGAKKDSALEHFQKALKLNPDSAIARVEYANGLIMASCDALVARVLKEHGRCDYLVNNAGRSIRRGVVNSFDRFHDFERTMQLNYFGSLRLIFGFLPKMLEQKRGHIINISSIGVLSNAPRFSAYVASKSALDSFSACAASEFLDKGINFTTINMHRRLRG